MSEIRVVVAKARRRPGPHYNVEATLSKQRSTLLPQTATMSNDSIVKFRPFDNAERCFDIVAVFGNNVAGFGNNIERNCPFHKVETN